MDRHPNSRARGARAAAGGLALLAFVVSDFVDARPQPRQEEPMPQMACEQPHSPQTSPSANFGPRGGLWWNYIPAEAVDAHCDWVAGEQKIAATIEHYPAREDPSGAIHFGGWSWVMSEVDLDPGVAWGLSCSWLPAGCTPEACPDRRQTVDMPPREIYVARDPGVALEFVDPVIEIHTCDGQERLRLRTLAQIDDGFWQDGGVLRVGYADGSWALTGVDLYEGGPMDMIRVPAPRRDEAWFGVEVVRGDGVVLKSVRFDVGATLFDNPQMVQNAYGGGYDPYAGRGEVPQSRGCRRR